MPDKLSPLDQVIRVIGCPIRKQPGSAVRAAIGEALRSRYEVPQRLPHGTLALRMKMNALQEINDFSS